MGAVILYTCGRRRFGPGLLHPCAKAGKALDVAGLEYELRTVRGYRASPWTWRSRDADRAEVRRLSGTNEVPILVLDDGEVISGSNRIARWARRQRGAAAAAG
jgi:glutathione S-transferase